MRARTKALLDGAVLTVGIVAAAALQPGPPKQIDLEKWFAAGKLRAVNRDLSKLPDRPDGLHMSERPDPGIAWIEGLEFTEGTIEVDVRGRDRFQRSFLGIAFHGKDDKTLRSGLFAPV